MESAAEKELDNVSALGKTGDLVAKELSQYKMV